LPLWTLIHTLSLRYSKSSMNLIQEVIQLKKKKRGKKTILLMGWFMISYHDSVC
jgi:hypothetical protein